MKRKIREVYFVKFELLGAADRSVGSVVVFMMIWVDYDTILQVDRSEIFPKR